MLLAEVCCRGQKDFNKVMMYDIYKLNIARDRGSLICIGLYRVSVYDLYLSVCGFHSPGILVVPVMY